MMHSNKHWLAATTTKGALLALLVLALLATACTKGINDVGVGLPTAQSNTGAYLIDTITVRSSTILRDSVISSNSAFLLVGRATDPQLGTLTARSAFRLGLSAEFRPDASFVYDSVILILNPDSSPKYSDFRYGDTTKTQSLLQVRRLNTAISDTKVSFSSPKYTKMDYDPSDAAVLNQGGAAGVTVRRAGLPFTSLRLPLSRAFGTALLKAGQVGQLTTQDQLDTYLPGLVLTPAAADNAAILRLNALATTSGVFLYYHDPLDPATVLSASFTLVNGVRHFYQVEADRSTAGIKNIPTTPLQPVAASSTGEQTIIEGAIGLQTKLEFPYLLNLRDFGANLTITSANLTAYVPPTTLGSTVPLPPRLAVNTSDGLNRPIGSYSTSVSYLSSLSSVTGVQQGSYTFSVQSYIQAVLSNAAPNNGLLLTPGLLAPVSATLDEVTAPELPVRVVLGSARNLNNRLQVRLYLIQVK